MKVGTWFWFNDLKKKTFIYLGEDGNSNIVVYMPEDEEYQTVHRDVFYLSMTPETCQRLMICEP